MTEQWGSDFFKKGWYYIQPSEQWVTDLFGYESPRGVQDFIYNNCRMIIETQDKSDWALHLFAKCKFLLRERQRWPEFLQEQIPWERQCKTRLGSLYNKEKFRHYKRVNERREEKGEEKVKFTCKSRSWRDCTRDIYISGIACAVFFDDIQFIKDISIPWYLWRPNTWAWHHYLQNPTEKGLNRYDFWNETWTWSKKEFVSVLNELRTYAILNRKIDQND